MKSNKSMGSKLPNLERKPGNSDFNQIVHDAHHAEYSQAKDIPLHVSHCFNYSERGNVTQENVSQKNPTGDCYTNVYKDKQKETLGSKDKDIRVGGTFMSQPTSSYAPMQKANNLVGLKSVLTNKVLEMVSVYK